MDGVDTKFQIAIRFNHLKGWGLWIPAQGINLALIPYQYRILFMQLVTLIWNTLLTQCET